MSVEIELGRMEDGLNSRLGLANPERVSETYKRARHALLSASALPYALRQRRR